MKFTIITHAEHKLHENEIFAYEPYVKEMNLWLKHVDEVQIVAPLSDKVITAIDSRYYKNEKIPKQIENDGIQFVKIPSFEITSIKNSIKAILKIPSICYSIYKSMQWADHIHVRCPGNIGLLGCFIQTLFPKKPKTVKYAGNWDPNSKQPYSYKLQKRIISNTFFTKNCKVLVYGEWPNQSKNIIPFFTASYSEKEIDNTKCHPELVEGCFDLKRDNEIATSLTPRNDGNECQHELVEGLHNTKLKFIFVGGLTPGKQPFLSIQIIHELKKKGYKVELHMYGDGGERTKISDYILDNSLEDVVLLHGNSTKEVVKKAYQQAHFLVFISKSEGWPKVVAEAMFWGCVPITSNVSCIPYMLDFGNRGAIVNSTIDEIILAIESYLKGKEKYIKHVEKSMEWSQQYTLEKFEKEIGKLLCSSQKRI